MQPSSQDNRGADSGLDLTFDKFSLAAFSVVSVLLFVALVSVWGSPSRVAFGSPDEALTAHVIDLLDNTGRPVSPAQFDDPAELEVQRLWSSVDGVSIPTHMPFMAALYAAVGRIVPGGEWIVFALPAIGLGAVVAALSLLLDRRRRWLALLFPGLAFIVTFRFMKPWENMATMLSFAGLAFLAGVVWSRSTKRHWPIAMWVLIAAAGSTRPDQAHVLLAVALAFSLYVSHNNDRQGSGLVWSSAFGAGIVVFGSFLIGNTTVTGSPLLPPTYLLETRAGAGLFGRNLEPPFSFVASLLLPNGVPVAESVWFHLDKYWWALGPIRYVTVLGVAALVWTTRTLIKRRNKQLLFALSTGLLASAYLLIVRVNTTNWGANAPEPSLGHSYPRYVALVYAAAAVFVIISVSRVKSRAAFALLSSLLVLTAYLGLQHVYNGEPETSFNEATHLIDAYEDYATQVDQDAPDNALLYVRFTDKYLWSVRPTLVLPTEPGAAKRSVRVDMLAQSLRAAIDNGFRPLVFETSVVEDVELEAALAPLGLVLVESDVGEDPELRDVLIRWHVWEIEETRE